MTETLKKQLGNRAENQAAEFLSKQHHMVLITQNYSSHLGEIDLIMRDNKDIVFVEVRSRSHLSLSYGNPIESINKTKQKKIIRTAIHFLQQKKWLNKINYRFDIIGILDDQLEWIKNAFASEMYS